MSICRSPFLTARGTAFGSGRFGVPGGGMGLRGLAGAFCVTRRSRDPASGLRVQGQIFWGFCLREPAWLARRAPSQRIGRLP